MTVTLDLVLIGFGNVARRFVTLVAEQRGRIASEHGLNVRVIAIATKRHGQLFSPSGVRAASLAARVAADQSIRTTVSTSASPPLKRRPARDTSSLAFLRDVIKRSAAAARQRRLVVIETTTLDIARGEPAISHIRAGLAGGAHVITANKGPVAFAHRSLARAADRSGRRFLFEGAVMDGIPVFNLVRETLPVVRVIGFRGVVNSTTNYMLTAMERGQPFAEALADMQARGVAEADASLDVDGWDAAAKTAALANVLLGAAITPHTVDRQGISAGTGRLALDARAAGRRLKLVARGERQGRRVTARVALEALPADDLLAGLDGQQNAIILQTDLLGEIAVVQRGGSLTETAYALVSDLVTIARDVRARRATRQSRPSARQRRSL
jgi:homoserine dehydrogenase